MAILRVYIVDQTDLWSIILLDLDAISMAKIPVFFCIRQIPGFPGQKNSARWNI